MHDLEDLRQGTAVDHLHREEDAFLRIDAEFASWQDVGMIENGQPIADLI
jgi:hypothetical protein